MRRIKGLLFLLLLLLLLLVGSLWHPTRQPHRSRRQSAASVYETHRVRDTRRYWKLCTGLKPATNTWQTDKQTDKQDRQPTMFSYYYCCWRLFSSCWINFFQKFQIRGQKSYLQGRSLHWQVKENASWKKLGEKQKNRKLGYFFGGKLLRIRMAQNATILCTRAPFFLIASLADYFYPHF